MLESERCFEVAHIRMHLGFGAEYWFMRLRLMAGSTEVAVLDVTSARDLGQVLSCIHDEGGSRFFRATPMQVHVWHSDTWWNLSGDLSQFLTWIIETGVGTLDETRAFAANPLSRSDWLFEAAWQMKTLLNVASEAQPNEPQILHP